MGIEPDSKAKIAKPSIKCLIQEDILRLDISVDDATLMQINKCLQYLPEYFPFNCTLLSIRVLFQELLKV